MSVRVETEGWMETTEVWPPVSEFRLYFAAVGAAHML
jgi:hypothetical protein